MQETCTNMDGLFAIFTTDRIDRLINTAHLFDSQMCTKEVELRLMYDAQIGECDASRAVNFTLSVEFVEQGRDERHNFMREIGCA